MTEQTKNTNQFIVLDNAMYSKIGTWVLGHFTIYFQTTNQETINVEHIVSIKKCNSVWNNVWNNVYSIYYVITLTNGKQIYVHDHEVKPSGLLSSRLSKNPDFDKIEKLVKQNS